MMYAYKIFSGTWSWMNFVNQSTFAKVMIRSQVFCFLTHTVYWTSSWTHGSQRDIVERRNCSMSNKQKLTFAKTYNHCQCLSVNYTTITDRTANNWDYETVELTTLHVHVNCRETSSNDGPLWRPVLSRAFLCCAQLLENGRFLFSVRRFGTLLLQTNAPSRTMLILKNSWKLISFNWLLTYSSNFIY